MGKEIFKMRNSPEKEKMSMLGLILTRGQEVADVLSSLEQVVEPMEKAVRKMRPKPIFDINNRNTVSPETLVDVLTNTKITRSSQEDIVEERIAIRDKIEHFMRLGSPIEFCLIAFHPKSHNPIETGMRRLPDLGELGFLKRLLDIDRTVSKVFPPGVSFTVCYEGSVFAGRFGNTWQESEEFRAQLDEFIRLLGGVEKIKLVDLAEIVNQRSDFAPVFDQEMEKLLHGLKVGDSDTRDQVQGFLPVMRRSSVDLSSHSLADLIAIHNAHSRRLLFEDLTPRQSELFRKIEQKAVENAIFYVAFNNTRRKLKIMETAFPDKIYISVTTKPGRLAIHAVHQGIKFLPHHGVPILKGRHSIIEIVQFQSLVGRRGLESVKVEGDRDSQPFFFREKKRNSNHPIPGPYEAWSV